VISATEDQQRDSHYYNIIPHIGKRYVDLSQGEVMFLNFQISPMKKLFNPCHFHHDHAMAFSPTGVFLFPQYKSAARSKPCHFPTSLRPSNKESFSPMSSLETKNWRQLLATSLQVALDVGKPVFFVCGPVVMFPRECFHLSV
jgi:hypothetical protein